MKTLKDIQAEVEKEFRERYKNHGFIPEALASYIDFLNVQSEKIFKAGIDAGEKEFVCGDLKTDGKIESFIGGCGKPVKESDSYRCADCTASFHRDCIRKHFK